MHPRQSRIKHDQNTPARTKPRTGNNHKRRKMPQTNTPATAQTHDIRQPGEPDQGKTEQKQPKYQQKTLTAIQLVNSEVDPRTALQIVNNKDKISPSAVHYLKQKVNKWSLKHPKTVKAANSQVTRILSGETRSIPQQKVTKSGEVVEFTETIAPSDSNILAAAAMVYDRFEPTRQPEAPGGGLTVNIIPIAAQEIIDRMTAWKTRQVEGNVIDVQSGGQIEAGNG